MKNPNYIKVQKLSDTVYVVNDQKIDLETLSFNEAIQHCNWLADLAKQQFQKNVKLSEAYQQSKTKYKLLAVLNKSLDSLVDKLRPSKRVWIMTSEGISPLDLSEQQADIMLSSGMAYESPNDFKTSQAQFTGDSVTV